MGKQRHPEHQPRDARGASTNSTHSGTTNPNTTNPNTIHSSLTNADPNHPGRTTAQPQKQKQGIRAFLTPGWILTLVFVLAFTYFAFTVLAPWQLGKNTRQSHFNERLKAAMQQDPVPVAEVIPANGKPVNEDKDWTHVTLQGHFLPHEEVLLRNRPVESAPAYQVLTPFETADGLRFIVNRGWLPADAPGKGKAIDNLALPPSGERNLSGYVRLGEGRSEGGVLNAEGHEQTTSINAAQIGEARGVELAHDYVQLDADSVGKIQDANPDNVETPHAIPLPQIESGPYLSYGIQWIAFGIIAPILLGWFVWSEIRERRRERAEEEALAGAGLGAPTGTVNGAAPGEGLGAPTGTVNGAAPGEGADASAGAVAGTSAENAMGTATGVDPGEGTGAAEAEAGAKSEPARDTDSAESQMEARYGKSRRRRGFGIRNEDDGERF